MTKKKTKPTAAPKSLMISFRLPNDAVAADLAAKALAAGKSSANLFARELVTGALVCPDETAQLLRELTGQLQVREDRLLRQVKLLREDLATSVNILLAAAGQLTQEDARSWTDTNLLKHQQ
jgi:hypothetical protein